MTVIVGFAHRLSDTAWLGGDSAFTGGDNRYHRKDKKIVRKGEILFGSSGSCRVGDIFEHVFTPPEQSATETDDKRFLVRDFVPALRSCLQTHGAEEKNNEVARWDVRALIGYRGRLYEMHGDYQVGEPLHYAAVGAGREYALGAIFSLVEPNGERLPVEQYEAIDVPNLLRKAMTAASYFNSACGPPFTIMSTEGRQAAAWRELNRLRHAKTNKRRAKA